MSAAEHPTAASAPTSASGGAGTPDRLVRLAAVLALAGLTCVLLFLLFGFLPWTVGVGLFLGVPLLGVAMLLYLFVVLRNLKQRGEL